MCYDNSELLKNYVHAYQATGKEFFAAVAKNIIRWMDEWLSNREHGGFYASQDADYSMDDDGDYFTWTLEETQKALTSQEAQAACLRYDINEIGEMHHNPAKNVLHVRASLDEIGKRMNLQPEAVTSLLKLAKQKMYAARLQRPTPYVDKTIYTGWCALCVSAYLEAAKALAQDSAKHFALRSLDRILSEGWTAETGLSHVIAYADPKAEKRATPGMLDDYAFTAIACLDAYESTADLNYFHFAKKIADQMVTWFYDETGGGFFDTPQTNGQLPLGVLGTRRKPFQDSPTPAGNSVAAIALLRLHALSNEKTYREKAEQTLEILAGSAGQFGIFAATYGIAAVHFSQPHEQLVIIGEDKSAEQFYAAAIKQFSLTRSVVKLASNQAVAQNLPPALAETIPNQPSLKDKKTFAVLCRNQTCLPPIHSAEELKTKL